MRVVAAAVFAGAASGAVTAAISQSSSGMFINPSSHMTAAPTTSFPHLDPTLSPPLVEVTLAAAFTPSPTAAIRSLEATLVNREHTHIKVKVITETDLAHPTSLPTPGGFKTIGCGCSYLYPNGYIECPFSGSKAPPGFCSSDVVTSTESTRSRGHSHSTEVASLSLGMNPTSVLSSIIEEATAWPSGIHPGMPSGPFHASCVTTLKGTFALGQKVTPASKKAGVRASIPQISLINGMLVDDTNRIGCIVANGQFQFDLTPQAGTLFIAGWSACGTEGHRSLALGGSTTLYACNSGDFSNFYYKPVGSNCAPIELAIVEDDTTLDSGSDHPRRGDEESDLSFAELLNSDSPSGCSTDLSQSPFNIHVIGAGELSQDGHGSTTTPFLLLSRYSIGPIGVLKDVDGRAATFDEYGKLRFEYNVFNELPWSTCENNVLAFGETRGFYECGSKDFPAIYSEDIGEDCVQIKLVFQVVSESAPLPQQPYVPAAPVISVPSVPLARRSANNRASSNTDSDITVPSGHALADPAIVHVDRREPGFLGGHFNDQPANLNYLLTTKTISVPAQTGVFPSDDGTPETTWTVPATTIVLTESPAPTKVLNARQDGVDNPIASVSYYASILSSAKSELSAMQTLASASTLRATTTEQSTAGITSAPDLSQALAMRQDHDAIWTLDQLLSTILSASSASEYWGWIAASISMDLYESTVTFVNTACATYDGTPSCTTESLLFATQAPPAARAVATATASTTASLVAPAQKHNTISVVTKTVTTSETIVKPSTTLTTTYTTIDTCTEYIGGRCIEKRQVGNPCPDVDCTAYTTLTRDFPLSTYTFPGDGTTRTTTIPAYTTTETWYQLPGGDQLKRKADETSIVTTSVVRNT